MTTLQRHTHIARFTQPELYALIAEEVEATTGNKVLVKELNFNHDGDKMYVDFSMEIVEAALPEGAKI